jgi:hypothetical protein
MKLRYVLVLATVLTAVGTFAGPAEASRWVNCYWDGSRPICAGRCRPGWTQLKREGSGCITGARVYCCVSGPKSGTAHDKCRQGARMGEPGCPYPRFGPKPRPVVPDRRPCPPRMFRGGDGQCYPRLN